MKNKNIQNTENNVNNQIEKFINLQIEKYNYEKTCKNWKYKICRTK